jgi:hypothetical protein
VSVAAEIPGALPLQDGAGDRGNKAGVETDVLGIRLDRLAQNEVDAVTAVHPRPNFNNGILQAFTDGFQERPDTHIWDHQRGRSTAAAHW